jgi:hypothetical protein
MLESALNSTPAETRFWVSRRPPFLFYFVACSREVAAGRRWGLLFWLDQRHNYAPNDFDNRLEESLTYQLPFGQGKRWLSSGITSSPSKRK